MRPRRKAAISSGTSPALPGARAELDEIEQWRDSREVKKSYPLAASGYLGITSRNPRLIVIERLSPAANACS